MSVHKSIRSLAKFLSPRFQTVHFDYRKWVKPRYSENYPHGILHTIIQHNQETYHDLILRMHDLKGHLHDIPLSTSPHESHEPVWNNGFLPGLDIFALYAMVAKHRPARYIEVGSGNSTKVVSKAIRELGLNTQITSIDPQPRAEIDVLATNVIRKPLEQLGDVGFIPETLEPGDILFIDNSHHVFPNSDAMVCFMEILPRLKKGVVVHIHDIYLPYDYPQFMCDRYYNEQYTLAAFVMSDPERYVSAFPAFYVSLHPILSEQTASLFRHPGLETVETHGCSFWLCIGRDPSGTTVF